MKPQIKVYISKIIFETHGKNYSLTFEGRPFPGYDESGKLERGATVEWSTIIKLYPEHEKYNDRKGLPLITESFKEYTSYDKNGNEKCKTIICELEGYDSQNYSVEDMAYLVHNFEKWLESIEEIEY